jgi:hypothetical protein
MDARENGAVLSDNRRTVAIAAREPMRQGMGFGNERVQGEAARLTLWRNDCLDHLRPQFRGLCPHQRSASRAAWKILPTGSLMPFR